MNSSLTPHLSAGGPQGSTLRTAATIREATSPQWATLPLQEPGSGHQPLFRGRHHRVLRSRVLSILLPSPCPVSHRLPDHRPLAPITSLSIRKDTDPVADGLLEPRIYGMKRIPHHHTSHRPRARQLHSRRTPIVSHYHLSPVPQIHPLLLFQLPPIPCNPLHQPILCFRVHPPLVPVQLLGRSRPQ